MRDVPLHLYLLALSSSVLQSLPFPIAGPVPLWRRLFCWICLVPLFLALLGKQASGKRLNLRQSAILGYASGIVWYLLNCYWIYPTMHLYGDIPTLPSVGILLLFALYLGLYLALFAALFGLVRKLWSEQTALLLAPVLWVTVELARDRITGFPWDLLGYAQVDNLVLTRLAPWTGVFGLSLVVALVNMLWSLPALRLSKASKIRAICLAATLTLTAVWVEAHPPSVAPASTTASVVLLQENLKVGVGMQKGAESREIMLAAFSALSKHPEYPEDAIPGRPDLILWPESPSGFVDSDPAYRSFMQQLASQTGAAIIADDVSVGPRTQDGTYSLYNSASFFASDGTYTGRYDKMHLVPFGEYVPYKPIFFFTGHLLDGLPFIPGSERRLFRSGTHNYGVFICYESIFGDEIRRFVADGAQVLVNLSDDGWYGDSSAPWEHLDMVRMRAIENHRWVLRSTNTGVTSTIDPYGRITQTMPRDVRGSLKATFDYEESITFYTRYGDWLAWICAVISAMSIALASLVRAFGPMHSKLDTC